MNINWFELAYQVFGGLCVFLFGMKAMSEGLQALASDFLRKVISWLTNNRVLAVLVGAVATVIIQSSSVTTVMVVGFVNAGLMTLAQAIGVILGANVGTTITGWIVALKIGKYGLVFLAGGLVPFFFLKHFVWKSIGRVCIALGLIFLGLEFMSNGFKPLTKASELSNWLTFFDASNFVSVIACVAVGCALTFIVQSSSAMLGITIALATTASPGGEPLIGLSTAVALVLGENIGTTVTAQLASIGGNVVAKRAAWAHTLFNTLGVCVMVVCFQPCMALLTTFITPAFDSLAGLFKIGAVGDARFAVRGFEIAAAHSLFNIVNVLLFLPFVPHLARLLERLKPDRGEGSKSRLKLLGDVAQVSPEFALTQAEEEVYLEADVTQQLFEATDTLVNSERPAAEQFEHIQHLERVTDRIQMEVTLFLTTVLQVGITPTQASRAYYLIRIADELESVADYCEALATYRRRLDDKGQQLSEAARAELAGLMAETERLFRRVVERVAQPGDTVPVDDLLAEGNRLRDEADRIRSLHLDRVQSGRCDALAGLTFSDMIVALRRIKNHSINVLEARNSAWQARFASEFSSLPAESPNAVVGAPEATS